MTLLEKQFTFSKLLVKLITYANLMEYEITLGEALRSPEEAHLMMEMGKGISNSLHMIKLAIDLNLFKNKVYLDSTEDHKVLGIYWESLSTPDYQCCWGGRFTKPDGNHYSISHGGIK